MGRRGCLIIINSPTGGRHLFPFVHVSFSPSQYDREIGMFWREKKARVGSTSAPFGAKRKRSSLSLGPIISICVTHLPPLSPSSHLYGSTLMHVLYHHHHHHHHDIWWVIVHCHIYHDVHHPFYLI